MLFEKNFKIKAKLQGIQIVTTNSQRVRNTRYFKKGDIYKLKILCGASLK